MIDGDRGSSRPHAGEESSPALVPRVAIIGCGAIGNALIEAWPQFLQGRFELASVLVRPDQVETLALTHRASARLVTSIEELLATAPDIVVEAAGHEAIIVHGEQILSTGCELILFSVGALADDDLRYRLQRSALLAKARIVIPTGALAGFDGLRCLRASGLRRVKYTCTKPVKAWRHTAAEEIVDLDALESSTSIFCGSARDAARAYPRNANLAAAVAFAGLGLDRTEVELIADPAATEIHARIEAQSATDELDVIVTGAGFSSNPKSSRITAMSAIAALYDRTQPVMFA
jgi:aspartate dehydrogenase